MNLASEKCAPCAILGVLISLSSATQPSILSAEWWTNDTDTRVLHLTTEVQVGGGDDKTMRWRWCWWWRPKVLAPKNKETVREHIKVIWHHQIHSRFRNFAPLIIHSGSWLWINGSLSQSLAHPQHFNVTKFNSYRLLKLCRNEFKSQENCQTMNNQSSNLRVKEANILKLFPEIIAEEV